MSHNARIYPDGFYANGVPYPATAWQTLDTNITKLVHEGGGTWSPAALITIGGAGMWCAGPWTLSGGGSMQLSESTSYLTHGDNDYIVLGAGHTGASRQIGGPFGTGRDLSNGTAKFLLDAPGTGGMLNYAGGAIAPGGRVTTRLYVHHSATFTEAVFYYRVSSAHLPQNFPQFRVYRVDANGVATALSSAASLVSGFLVPQYGTGAAYYSGGSTSLIYVTDANTVIDTTRYSYFAEVIDESGTGALSGNTFTSVVMSFTNIPDMRPQ